MATQHHVVLFMKPACHLCEIARGWLEDFAAAPDRYAPFELDEVDIRHDPAVFAEYRYRIPVIFIDDEIVAEGRMDDEAEFALGRALALSGKE